MTRLVGAGPSGNSISGLVVTALTVVGQTGAVAKDRDILDQVNNLVAEEQELRAKLQNREIDESEEHQRLRAVEVALDQCWDLLRQRRALRETGGDPREARVRPPGEVEGYLG
jgi:siroheme synthase